MCQTLIGEGQVPLVAVGIDANRFSQHLVGTDTHRCTLRPSRLLMPRKWRTEKWVDSQTIMIIQMASPKGRQERTWQVPIGRDLQHLVDTIVNHPAIHGHVFAERMDNLPSAYVYGHVGNADDLIFID